MTYPRLKVGDKIRDFSFQSPWSAERKLFETIGNNPAILLFLRYQGCPVCQMEMANLKREMELFTKKKAKVFVILQSSTEQVASAANEEDWPFCVICDPRGVIFRQFGVEEGSILQYIHPAGMIAVIHAVTHGFPHGKFEGKETQLPAAFSISQMKVIAYAYYGKHINDLPSHAALAASIE